MFKKIPFMLFRGGTSKGPLFLNSALPKKPCERDRLLLGLLGSPQTKASQKPENSLPVPLTLRKPNVAGALQVDGLGGGESVTSKALVISPSVRPRVDVEYLICEVRCGEPIVDTSIDCGNMLAAVGPYAVEMGLVAANKPRTLVKIYSQITKTIIEAEVPTPNGHVAYNNTLPVEGMPSTGALVKLHFIDPAGTTCGSHLPTGQPLDEVDGVEVSCVDVSMPMVMVNSKSVGKTGYESKSELDADVTLMDRLEKIRQVAALKMQLGDVRGKIMPKICMVSPSQTGGTLSARYIVAPFSRDCHPTMAVTGALCLAGAAVTPGTLVNTLATPTHVEASDRSKSIRNIIIEHPGGKFDVELTLGIDGQPLPILKASFLRTARLLAQGTAYAPFTKAKD